MKKHLIQRVTVSAEMDFTINVPVQCQSCHRIGTHNNHCLTRQWPTAVALQTRSGNVSTVSLPGIGVVDNQSNIPRSFLRRDLPQFQTHLYLGNNNGCVFWDRAAQANPAQPVPNAAPGPPMAPIAVPANPIAIPTAPQQQPAPPPVAPPQPALPQQAVVDTNPQPVSAPQVANFDLDLVNIDLSSIPHPSGIQNNGTQGAPPGILSSTPRPDLAAANQVANAQPGLHCNQPLTAAAFASLSFDQNLLGDLPTFEGNKDKFRSWKHRMETAVDFLGDERGMKILRSRLGAKPSDYLQMRPSVATVRQALEELSKEYDPIGGEMKAANAFAKIKQNARPISDHHAEIYSLLKNMGKDTGTKESMLINTYVHSLTSLPLKQAIFRKWNGENMTLAQIMSMADQSEKAQTLACGTVDATVPAASAPPASCAVASDQQMQVPVPDNFEDIIAAVLTRGFQKFGAGQQTPQKPGIGPANFGPEEGCLIHRTRTHKTAVCYSRMATKCFYCRTEVSAGELANHIRDKCMGPKCFKCGALNHKSRMCGRGRFNPNHQAANNPHTTAHGSSAPKRPRTVTVACAQAQTEPTTTSTSNVE